MKIRNKLYLLLILFFVIIYFTNFLITEIGYNNIKYNIIQSSLQEENTIKTYIYNSYLSSKYIDRLNSNFNPDNTLRDDKDIIIEVLNDIFNNNLIRELMIQMFDHNKHLIAANHNNFPELKRNEIDEVYITKRNYILRRIDNKLYIFIAEIIDFEDNKYILSIIKDISFIDEVKTTQQSVYLTILITIIITLAVLLFLLRNSITKPLEKLVFAARRLSTGHYNERVDSNKNDEIGILAIQFNKMAEEIENKISILETQAYQKQMFIDNLTHEVKNPLTSIIGYAELLQKAKYNKSIFNKSINHIHNEANRILKIIDKLFELIMLRNKLNMFNKVNINELFKEVKESVHLKLNIKNITLSINTENNHCISIDKALIKLAIINLIDNAFKASMQDSEIILGYKTLNNKSIIYVKDSGKGIPEKEIEKITQPFYQVDKSHSSDYSGVGLGLALCREIIKLHKGKIQIESKEGEGTTVNLIFKG